MEDNEREPGLFTPLQLVFLSLGLLLIPLAVVTSLVGVLIDNKVLLYIAIFLAIVGTFISVYHAIKD